MNTLPARIGPTHRRQRIRLWIPLLLVLVLLSPLLIPLTAIAMIVAAAFGSNPWRALVTVARFVAALRGTRIDVEARTASILISIV